MTDILKLDNITDAYIEKLILPSPPDAPLWNRESFIFSKKPKWNYIDSCMIKALLMLYRLNGDSRLLEYSIGFTDFYVNDDGRIPTMNPLDFNLDNINGGKNLIELFRLTGKNKYRLAANKLITEQLASQPRLDCGSFFHKAVYPFQIWLDGAYMALPFLAEYAAENNRNDIADDVTAQLLSIKEIMRCPENGLYYHGYDEKKLSAWADKSDGLSGEFWLRSMGWLAAALADISEIAADKFTILNKLCREMLCGLLYSLSGFISDEGMLFQLPAKPELEGNYPETSGSLLIAYSALKAYRLGFGTDKNKTDGVKLLSSAAENYIVYDENKIPVLRNICLSAGLGGTGCRDGSSDYYLNETVVENDAKGIAPYLMAYSELKRIRAQ